VRLTKAQRQLLEIVRRAADKPNGFVPRVDHAHHKNQPLLYQMKADGLIQFTGLNPLITITPAGRAALASSEGDGDRETNGSSSASLPAAPVGATAAPHSDGGEG